MANADGDLKRQFWIRLWIDALLRRETVVVAATTVAALAAINLSPLAGRLPGFAWIAIAAFGVAAALWVAWEAAHDADRQARIVRRVLIDPADIDNLADDTLRGMAAQAHEMRDRIAELLHAVGRGGTGYEEEISTHLDGWLGHFLALARRLDALKREVTRSTTQNAAARSRSDMLAAKLEGENDPRTRTEIETTLSGYQRRFALTEEMERVVDRATLKFEQSANLISSVHARLLLTGVEGLEAGPWSRLQEEITADMVDLDRVAAAVKQIEGSGAPGADRTIGHEDARGDFP